MADNGATEATGSSKSPAIFMNMLSLLDDDTFADVTIVVGRECTKEYKLHRAIITLNSDLFKAACNENTFLEGKTKTITLPDITSRIFDPIVRYLYGAGYTVDLQAIGVFCNVYAAADFLGVPTLRREMERGLADYIGRVYRGARLIDEPTHIFIRMVDTAHSQDWAGLGGLFQAMMPGVYTMITKDVLREISTSETNCNYFLSLFVDKLQDRVHESVCLNFPECLKKDSGVICVLKEDLSNTTA